MKFKVGDRVRVIATTGPNYEFLIGLEGVIVSRRPSSANHDWVVDFGWPMHEVTSLTPSQGQFKEAQLRPTTPPSEKEWNEFKEKYFAPDPAVLLATERA